MDFFLILDRMLKNEYNREELELIAKEYFSKYSTCPNNFKNLVQLNNVKIKSNNCIDILKLIYNTHPKWNVVETSSNIVTRNISNATNIRSDSNIRSDKKYVISL
jgi:hypothetical protein